jgi:Uma2 family endonuclease
LNPLLIGEVLSPGTREYDRGAKFGMCKGIPSLEEYLLVDAEKAYIESFRRRDGEWFVTAFDGLDNVCRLESLNCEIPMSLIYRKATWLD